MRCISDGDIQRYLDTEMTRDEVAYVESHISACNPCAMKIDKQRRMVAGFKKIMNWTAPAIQIHPFRLSETVKMHPVYSLKKLAWELSAAGILILMLILISKKSVDTSNEFITKIPPNGIEIDANKPITDQPMVIITIIDPEGNITEYID